MADSTPLPRQRDLMRHVDRAHLRVAAMTRDLRWETGLDEDGLRLRRLVTPWEPDSQRPDNAYDARREADGATP